jgi:uncharacterized protein
LKSGARYIAIASGPIKDRKKTILVGIILRNNYIEGVLSTRIAVDGTDSTDKIIKMIKGSRFKDQARILVFNGIALAGLNVINLKMLEKKLDVRIILINRRRQDAPQLIKAMNTFASMSRKNVEDRIDIVREYSRVNPIKINGLFVQSEMEQHHLKNFTDRAFEAIRIAHIIASGVSTGESKGRI